MSDGIGDKLPGNRTVPVLHLPDAYAIAMPILIAIPLQLLDCLDAA
jgi:hypothetical protein